MLSARHAGVADATRGQLPIYAPDTVGPPGKSSGRRVSANDAASAGGVSRSRWPRARGRLRRRHPYGAGILLRLAALRPARIGRAAVVEVAGIAGVRRLDVSLAAGYVSFLASGDRVSLKPLSNASRAEPGCAHHGVDQAACHGTRLDTEMPRNATVEELAGLAAPVMVLAGEHDPLSARADLASRAAVPQPGARRRWSRGSSTPAASVMKADQAAARLLAAEELLEELGAVDVADVRDPLVLELVDHDQRADEPAVAVQMAKPRSCQSG